MGLIDAVGYKPSKPTYAIKIESGMMRFDYQLQPSSLYTLQEYIFDDDNPRTYGKLDKNSITFTSDVAHTILQDFIMYGKTKDTLLVYCSRGINRSPAVGIALNEIFQLGSDTPNLKARFPELNEYIYDTLIETARRLQLHP